MSNVTTFYRSLINGLFSYFLFSFSYSENLTNKQLKTWIFPLWVFHDFRFPFVRFVICFLIPLRRLAGRLLHSTWGKKKQKNNGIRTTNLPVTRTTMLAEHNRGEMKTRKSHQPNPQRRLSNYCPLSSIPISTCWITCKNKKNKKTTLKNQEPIHFYSNYKYSNENILDFNLCEKISSSIIWGLKLKKKFFIKFLNVRF